MTSMAVPPLDHLIYAAPNLEAAVADLETRLGVRAAPGGSHPGKGTRNALLALGRESYLEIMAPDPDQSDYERPRWLGLDDLTSPRMAAWVVRSTDLEDVVRRAERAGVSLGAVLAGGRRRADGTALNWRVTDPRAVAEDGLIPFFIDWGGSPHAAASAPGGIELAALRGEHPQPGDMATRLGSLGLDLPVTRGPRAALIAVLDTPRGLVELR